MTEFLGLTYVLPARVWSRTGTVFTETTSLTRTFVTPEAQKWGVELTLEATFDSDGALLAHQAEYSIDRAFTLPMPQPRGAGFSGSCTATGAAGDSEVYTAGDAAADVGRFVTLADDEKVYVLTAALSPATFPSGFTMAAAGSADDTEIDIDGASTSALTRGMRFTIGSSDTTVYTVTEDVAAAAADTDTLTVGITPGLAVVAADNATLAASGAGGVMRVYPSLRKAASARAVDFTPALTARYAPDGLEGVIWRVDGTVQHTLTLLEK